MTTTLLTASASTARLWRLALVAALFVALVLTVEGPGPVASSAGLAWSQVPGGPVLYQCGRCGRWSSSPVCPYCSDEDDSDDNDNGAGGEYSYGVIKVLNSTSQAIKVYATGRRSDTWESEILQPGGWYYWYQPMPARFEISYDTDPGPGESWVRKVVNYNIVRGRTPSDRDGMLYEIVSVDGRHGLSTSYAVVTIYNNTTVEMRYQIRTSANAEWVDASVLRGMARYHWQTVPCRFEIRFDASFDRGTQLKQYTLDHNVVATSKPTAEDGQPYQFLEYDQDVDLKTGVGTPAPFETLPWIYPREP